MEEKKSFSHEEASLIMKGLLYELHIYIYNNLIRKLY